MTTKHTTKELAHNLIGLIQSDVITSAKNRLLIASAVERLKELDIDNDDLYIAYLKGYKDGGDAAYKSVADVLGMTGDPGSAEVLAEVKRLKDATTWRPIEMAPKDGTRIDLLLMGQKRVFDCFWYEKENAFCHNTPDQYGTYGPSRVGSILTGEPTHYLLIPPLSAPPKDTSK